MTWDLSTFRKAGLHAITLFYGFAILMGIAAQFIDYIPPSELPTYLLILGGIGGIILYANRVLGWTLPRPIFFIISGGAAIFGVTHFSEDATKFALVALAAFIVCAFLFVSLFLVERRLIAAQARQQKTK